MIKINGRLINNEKFPNDEFKINGEEIIEAICITTNKSINNFNSLIYPSFNNIQFYYSGDESLIELMFVKSFIDTNCRKNIVDNLHLIIMYLPYSRMDRIKTSSDCFTLKYICNFINFLNFNSISVLEPHSNVCLGALNNAKKQLITPKILEKAIEDGLKFDYILYPDEGAEKRYSDSITETSILTSCKKRNWETRCIEKIKILGDIPTKPFDVVILDDLASSGGTAYYNGKALKELGANKITLIVTHCEDNIMSENKEKIGLLCREDNPIDRIITTNILLTKIHEKITIYDIDEFIDNII